MNEQIRTFLVEERRKSAEAAALFAPERERLVEQLAELARKNSAENAPFLAEQRRKCTEQAALLGMTPPRNTA